MNNLKSALLKKPVQAIPCQILGVDTFIRRLTAMEMIEHDEQMDALREKGDIRATGMLSARFILSALVDEEGKAIPEKLLPTESELLEAHDHGAVINAVANIQRCSYGTLEEAKKN